MLENNASFEETQVALMGELIAQMNEVTQANEELLASIKTFEGCFRASKEGMEELLYEIRSVSSLAGPLRESIASDIMSKLNESKLTCECNEALCYAIQGHYFDGLSDLLENNTYSMTQLNHAYHTALDMGNNLEACQILKIYGADDSQCYANKLQHDDELETGNESDDLGPQNHIFYENYHKELQLKNLMRNQKTGSFEDCFEFTGLIEPNLCLALLHSYNVGNQAPDNHHEDMIMDTHVTAFNNTIA